MSNARLVWISVVFALIQCSRMEIANTVPESWYSANVIKDINYLPQPISDIFSTSPDTFSTNKPIVVLSSTTQSPPLFSSSIQTSLDPFFGSTLSTGLPSFQTVSSVDPSTLQTFSTSLPPVPSQPSLAPVSLSQNIAPSTAPSIPSTPSISPIPPNVQYIFCSSCPQTPQGPVASSPTASTVQISPIIALSTPPPLSANPAFSTLQSSPPNPTTVSTASPPLRLNVPSTFSTTTPPPLIRTSPGGGSTLTPFPCAPTGPNRSNSTAAGFPYIRIRMYKGSAVPQFVFSSRAPRTTTMRTTTTRRPRRNRRNNYGACVDACSGGRKSICAAPLATRPVDPEMLKGFPSICHMACHNSFKKNQYEKLVDGRCGRLRTRIRPVGSSDKIKKDDLNKAQYQVDTDPFTIIDFSPTNIK